MRVMEAIRFETTVGKDGTVVIPDVAPGERVEVIVLKLVSTHFPRRKGGWVSGSVVIHPDFDDPIPGMEEYA